jgi:Ca-activated chloride channel homolog
VKLVAHVIGFDIADPAAKQQLACIASNTGGVYLDAKDASGLESALNKAQQAAQGQKVKTEAPKKPKKDPLAEFNVQGIVRLSEDSDPLTGDGPNWRFFAPGSDEDGKGELLGDKVVYNAKLAQKLEPGDYVVVVEFEAARKVTPITVKEGEPLNLDISLDAGFVTSVAKVKGAGETKDLAWSVFKKSTVEGEEGVRIDTKYDQEPRFVIPAGDYVMRLTKDNAETLKEFTLVAGDSVNLDMSIDLGRLLAKALYAPGGPQVEKDLAYSVFKATSSIEGDEAVRVDTKYDTEPNFGLPTGKYNLKVSVGLATANVPFEVKSGEMTKMEVVLNAGVLGWKGADTESLTFFDAKLDINGERNRLNVSYDDAGNIAMPAGDYVLLATFADANTKEFTFSIKAGERTEVTIAP